MAVLVGGLVHAYMWNAYLPAFNTTHTPLEATAHVRSSVPSGPALTRRLAVVIVDGVGFDQVGRIAALAPIRARGAFRGTTVEFPSFTSPALTSFVTGTVPRDSGVRLNGSETGVPGLDSVTMVALDAGLPVRIRSRGWLPFESLMRAGPRADVHLGGVGYALETLRGHDAASPARELLLVYVGEPDSAAHKYGTGSPEFAEALEVAGTVVARTAATLDLDEDTLVVLSDHGHRRTRGHGGIEPEVMRAFFLVAGPAIKRGVVLPDRPLRDVASTLAVLAGLATPSSNTGRPMLDALELPDEQRAVILAGPFEQETRFLCTLHPTEACSRRAGITTRLAGGDPGAQSEAEGLADEIFAERARALDAAASGARARRVGLAGVVAALLLWTLYRSRGVDRGARPWIAALPAGYLLVYASALAVLGYRPTFSSLPPMAVFVRDSFIGAAVAAGAAVVFATSRRAGPLAPWVLLAGTALPFVVLAAWVGSDPRVLPPPVSGAVLFYAAPGVLFGAIAAALLSVAVARRRFSRRTPES